MVNGIIIVELYNTGSTVKDLTGEYGVSNVKIYKWIKKLTPNDYVKLQKEMGRLEEENEVFKKAMTIFARK